MSGNLEREVNFDKSNIVIFRKCGFISKYEEWLLENVNTVNTYKYLGLYLSFRCVFTHALHDLAEEERTEVVSILNVLW